MRNILLALLVLVTGAAQAASVIAAKSLQDPSYLIQRLDDPTLKSYLGSMITSSSVKIGVYDASDADYLSGVTGSYNLLDAVSGEKLVIPAQTIVEDVLVYTKTAALGGVTVAAGYSGSAGALFAATADSALTANAILDGVPVGTAATSIIRTSDTDATVTISGASPASAGKVYFIIKMVPGLN